MVELDFGRLRRRPDTIKVLVNRGVKGFITREPEALNMFSEGTYDLKHVRLILALIASTPVHVNLCHDSPVLREIAFKSWEPANSPL
jgi:hypothetical protein